MNKITLSIIVLLIISMLIFLNRISELKKEIKTNNYNISVMNDTLIEYKTKNGLLITEKQTYYSSLKELQSINKNLYDTVKYYEKELKRKINNIQVINLHGNIESKYDTIIKERIEDTLVYKATNKDSTITTNITLKLYNDSIISLSSNISIDNLKLNIITGYKKNMEYIASITTSDERIKIDNIDSWIRNENKRRLSLRPGLFTGLVYDPFNKELVLGIGLGLTLQYIK